METRHKGEVLTWDMSFYCRSSFIQVDQVFSEINEYFATLPDDTQDGIWVEYKRIHYVLDRIGNPKTLKQELIRHVAALYRYLDIDAIDQWVDRNPRITIPPGLKTEFDPGDTSHDRTYLRSEYHGLMVLALALRPVVPIWAVYIETIKGEFGKRWKEIQGYGLLRDTVLPDHPYMQRLLRYIEASTATAIEKDKSHIGLVINFLATSEIPGWLLACGLIRRLAVGNVSATVETESIISNFYNAVIKNTFESAIRSTANSFKAKNEPNEHDDNTSVYEEYKVKQSRSDGASSDISVYLCEYCDPTILLAHPVNAAIWDDCRQIEHAVLPTPVLRLHDGLMALVMGSVALKPIVHNLPPEIDPATYTHTVSNAGIMSPSSIYMLDAPARRRAKIITMAILWEWGFYELAAVMSCQPTILDDETIPSVQARARIQREFVEYFTDAYPYYQKAPGNSPTARKQNVACQFIDEMTEYITGPTVEFWKGPVPNALRAHITLTNRGEIVFSRNVKQSLSELVKLCYEQYPGN